MKLITLTPNPVLDLGGTVEKIIPNEKVYVHDKSRCPGGNGINVARVIRRLGLPVTAVGFLGGGIGDEISNLLKREKVDSEFVRIQNQTRINVTVSERNSHLQTRLSFPGPRIQNLEKKLLFEKISKLKAPAILMVGGSFPLHFSERDLIRILKICHQKGILTIVDSPGKILKRAVSQEPFLIKPNLFEFQDMLGKKVQSLPAVIREARGLNAKIPVICVSSVAGGAVLVTKDRAWFGKIPSVKIRSVVGAGDSMVGAMMAQIARDGVIELSEAELRIYLREQAGDLLRWGLAAACASLVHEGTALGTKKQTQSFYRRTEVSIL